ncbi:MAG: hypothetical protein M3024_04115 [Candidatus Dormibacteraeota bacterium]|nr:hypothetical protein [Candidatus Dormibacteraeota bacterium]
MKVRAALLTLVLALVACGAQPRADASAGRGQILYLAGPDGLAALDPVSGRQLRVLPAGVPAPDWRRLYTLDGGRLDAVDPATGAGVAAAVAPSWARTVFTSVGGGRVVYVGEPGAGGLTRLAIQDSNLARPATPITLRGRFTFDGLSQDGAALYLLEWTGQDHYQVRRYDVPAGALYAQPIIDKSDSTEAAMSGAASGRSLVTADGWMQLTLYVRAAGGAFVHALPLDSRFPFAFCLDLPGSGRGWALAAAPDGRTFYAVNTGTGRVAEIVTGTAGTDEPSVRVASFAPIGAPPLPAAVVASDGHRLLAAGTAGVATIDTGSLRLTGTSRLGATALSLASPKAGPLYVLTPGHLLALDPATDRVGADLPVSRGFTSIAHAG